MITLLSLLLVDPASAYSSGITGRSTSGCGGGGCHGTTASAATMASFSGATTVTPGSTVSMNFIVSNLSLSAGGFNVSTTGGTLNAGSNNRKSGSELTHSSRTAMTSGSVSFDFTWTAPTTEGTYTLRGAGNAVNSNGGTTGDAWNTGSVTVTVSDGCDDLDLDGFENCDGDCDDTNASVYPGAPGYCDGIEDTDCDGLVDLEESDMDDDGIDECDGDCDDADFTVFPGAAETCDDGIDQDCDGTDEVCPTPSCSVSMSVPSEGADLTAEGRFVWNGDCDGYWVELSPSASFPAYDTIYNARLSDSAGPQSLVFPAAAWPNISRRFVNGGYARVRGGTGGAVATSNVVSFDVSGVPSSFPTPVASCSVALVEPADAAVISGEPTFSWNTTCTAGRLEFSDDPTFPIENTVVIGAFSGNRATLNASRWVVVTNDVPFGGYWRVVAGASDGEHVSETRSWFVP